MTLPVRLAWVSIAGITLSVLFLTPVGVSAPWDKFLHFLFFGILALFAYIPSRSNRTYLKYCLYIVLFSAAIELLQSQLPDRDMSSVDLLANVAGVLLAATLMYAIRGRKRAAGQRP